MNSLDQAKNLIEKSQNIMIFPSPASQGDSLGTALALFFTLKKLGKNVNIICAEVPEKFKFLAELQPKEFVISVNTAEKEISEMRYEKNNSDLKIYLTLGSGNLAQNDFSFVPKPVTSQIQSEQGNILAPNLLIVLGSASLEELDAGFNENSGLFYKTPILNIDNHASNENFGEVNLTDTTCSVAEISTGLIRLFAKENLFSSETCTCLLTGVVWASQNFRNPKTRPQTFETSAFLIEKGADHQKIIQHLYKQKSISQIKLLGKILEKLNYNEQKELYSSSLTEEDFKLCQSSSKDLSFVVEELKFNFRYLPNLLILWESHASPVVIKGIFCSNRPELAEKILENFEGASRGEGVLFLARENNLDIVKEKVLKIL